MLPLATARLKVVEPAELSDLEMNRYSSDFSEAFDGV